LINDEAVETLQKGRNPRAYQRTEKLIAIARAIKMECATSVEDFLEEGVGDGEQKVRGVNFTNDPGIIMGGHDLVFQHTAKPRNAAGDMQREEKLAGLEAVAARRRRDEAEARLTQVREFKELSELDLTNQPNGVKKGIEARLAEITDALRAVAPKVVDEPEPEAESA
jgi:hypothetical protein